jgi:hypothetical protein
MVMASRVGTAEAKAEFITADDLQCSFLPRIRVFLIFLNVNSLSIYIEYFILYESFI